MARKLHDPIFSRSTALTVSIMQVLYKDHTIVNGARRPGFGDTSEGFIPVAVITWQMPDSRRRIMQLVKMRKVYSSADEASIVALEEAKRWIDTHPVDFEP
jgi:hypothetical protein